MNRRTALTAASALTLAAAAGLLTAGPINPPAGAVAPTMKTLAEVEPRTALSPANTPGDADSMLRIAQPGSYYLTGDVMVGAGKSGIEVATYGVTIDLNGFSITALPNSVSGIVTTNAVCTLTVRNGRILTPLSYGIVGLGPTLVEDVTVQGSLSSASVGIALYGRGSIARRCRVSDCVLSGIALEGPDSIAQACVVLSAGTDPFGTCWGMRTLGAGAQIRDCHIAVPTTMRAVQTEGTDTLVQGNTVSGGSVLLFSTGVVRDNFIHDVTSEAAIYALYGGHLIEGNRIHNCLLGIAAGTGAAQGPDTVVRNRITKCTSSIQAGGADVGPIGTAAASTSPNANIVN